MNNKKIVIILMSLTIIFVTLGSTFAYLNWESNDARKTNVTFTVNPDFTCGADGGGDITSNDVELIPTDCTNSTYAIKRKITTSTTTTGNKVVSMDLWLDVNSISTNLSNSDNFKYVFSKNGNSCTSGVISQGTFKNKQANDQVQLLDDSEYATLDDTYYLYIWLDKAETNINTMNQSFSFSLGGTCQDHGLEKATLQNLNTTAFFREADYKTKVTDIYFVYDEDLPSGIQNNNIKTYNMGANANRPITGYLIENTDAGADPDTYKVYVSSEYKIYAGSLQSAFNGMTALKHVSFDNFDTSYTTNMSQMFITCKSLVSADLSGFNTSNVTTMEHLFRECENLLSVNLNNLNTSKVTNMGYMFANCKKLTQIDVTGFDTYLTTKMYEMFASCTLLSTLDVSHFNTSNVNYMNYMFSGCSSLTTLDVSHFNTQNVIKMNSMFNGCSSLTSLDVSNWNTSSVDEMSSMFYGCSGLTSLDVSSFNTTNVNAMGNMFHSCSGLTSLDLSNFNTANVTTMANMFQDCRNLKTLNVSSFNTAKVASMTFMFADCRKLENLNLSTFTAELLTNMSFMFYQCYELENIDIRNMNTALVTNMSSTFRDCWALLSVNAKQLDMTNVTSYSLMFDRTSTTTTITVGSTSTRDWFNTNRPSWTVILDTA